MSEIRGYYSSSETYIHRPTTQEEKETRVATKIQQTNKQTSTIETTGNEWFEVCGSIDRKHFSSIIFLLCDITVKAFDEDYVISLIETKI